MSQRSPQSTMKAAVYSSAVLVILLFWSIPLAAYVLGVSRQEEANTNRSLQLTITSISATNAKVGQYLTATAQAMGTPTN